MPDTTAENEQLTWLSSLQALRSNQIISSNTQKLLLALRAPDVDIDNVCSLLASEPALAAKILMIANSAFYGYPRDISDIEEAVVLLGAVKLSNIIFTSIAIVESDNPLLKKYVQHVLLSSFFAKKVAEKIALKTQTPYIAGLLHLLPVILNFRPDIDALLTIPTLNQANEIILEKLNLPDSVISSINHLFSQSAGQAETLCLRFGFNLAILAAGKKKAPFPFLIDVEHDFNRISLKPDSIASILFETREEQNKLVQMVN